MKKPPLFTIELPQLGDEAVLAPVHVQSWKESYVTPESGLTEVMIDELIGHLLTNTDFRRHTIAEALKNPDQVLYRVVKNSRGHIVGFLHGSKDEAGNKLEGLYLLNEAKGTGTGGKLMTEFLAWAAKEKPSSLEVFSFNERALGFYEKYGFKRTNKPLRLYKNKLPVVEMVRPAE